METFFIRLWQPADSAERQRLEPGDLHGVVEGAASGAAEPFRDGEELLELLRRALRERDESTRVAG